MLVGAGAQRLGMLEVAGMARRAPTDALRGSIDLLVLKVLTLGPLHDRGISQRIQQLVLEAAVVS
jgi:hypothetical protein